MMALKWSQGQIDACAILNGTGIGEKLINIADILSRLDDRKFEGVLLAFQAYRRSFIAQGGMAQPQAKPPAPTPKPRRRVPLWND